MWIEGKLADKRLNSDTRAKLEALRAKGLAGKLLQRDLRAFLAISKPQTDAPKTFLSALFTLRQRGLRMKGIPQEAFAKLEGVIEVMQHAIAVRKAGEVLESAA